MLQDCLYAGLCNTFCVWWISACAEWQVSQTVTGLGFSSRGDRLACGLWHATHSPCAPGCGTLAPSIFFACSSWHIAQNARESLWVRTTLPSFAGWWQVSQLLSANGGCTCFCISLGNAESCGLWQLVHATFSKGCPWCAFPNCWSGHS